MDNWDVRFGSEDDLDSDREDGEGKKQEQKIMLEGSIYRGGWAIESYCV